MGRRQLLKAALLLGLVTGCRGGGDSDSGGRSNAPPLPGPPPGAAIVSAHRGGAAYTPENTMRAFRNAVRLGVDQLEADTQLSADGVLVLGDQAPAPAGAVLGLALINAAYAPQVAAYQAMFGPIDPRKQMFVAATDTFARAYSQTFSDIARDYGVYVVASNNQPRYRASQDPVEIALFKDPDLPAVDEVYIATDARVTNQTAIWGPRDVNQDAPAGEKNLLFRNDKVPLTALEKDLIAIDEGPATGDAARANAAGVEVAGFRLGFATSLPAFAWGYDFAQRPADLEPCADVRISYMPCMDALGVDVVVQAEANPGRWAITFDNSPPDAHIGVLMGFIEGEDGRRASEMTLEQRREGAIESFVRYFGEGARNPLEYIELSWMDEEWSRGCYGGVFGPGAWLNFGHTLRAPAGRIHWAGTETAEIWNGYMDGAIRSGERAADEAGTTVCIS